MYLSKSRLIVDIQSTGAKTANVTQSVGQTRRGSARDFDNLENWLSRQLTPSAKSSKLYLSNKTQIPRTPAHLPTRSPTRFARRHLITLSYSLASSSSLAHASPAYHLFGLRTSSLLCLIQTYSTHYTILIYIYLGTSAPAMDY